MKLCRKHEVGPDGDIFCKPCHDRREAFRAAACTCNGSQSPSCPVHIMESPFQCKCRRLVVNDGDLCYVCRAEADDPKQKEEAVSN
jgi:hypothetical protein